jgi:hypothetical protein
MTAKQFVTISEALIERTGEEIDILYQLMESR